MRKGRVLLVLALAGGAAVVALFKRGNDFQAIMTWNATCREALTAFKGTSFLLSPEEASRIRAGIEACCLSDSGVRPTRALARGQTDQLQRTVVTPLAEIGKNREAVVRNEWYLKARLMKPVGVDRATAAADLEGLPEEFVKLVPRLTPELEFQLRQVSGEEAIEPRLYNSLGAALGGAKLDLEHIVEAADTSPATKTEAEALYAQARSAFGEVKDKNDKLRWYRAERDDRGMTTEERKTLIAAQEEALGRIAAGDEAIKRLRGFFAELHEQYYTEVLRQDWKERREKYGHGEDAVIETFCDFSVVRRRVSPGGSADETEKAGSLEWYGSQTRPVWGYKADQAVGYIKWKPLHKSNKEILRGFKLNPTLAPLGESCLR